MEFPTSSNKRLPCKLTNVLPSIRVKFYARRLVSCMYDPRIRCKKSSVYYRVVKINGRVSTFGKVTGERTVENTTISVLNIGKSGVYLCIRLLS